MKKIVLSLALILGGLYIYAQDNDTTKIKLGDTKIIIIDKDNDNDIKTKKEKLEKGKEEFEKMQSEKQAQLDQEKQQIEEMKKQLEAQQDQMEKQKLELELQKNEQNLKELEKELEALDKGIEDIDRELDAENNDFNWNDDNDDNKKNNHDKYDWDFNEDWSSDWDNLSPFGKNKKFRGHWAGFDLGLNNYVNKDLSTTLSPEDRNFELNASGSWIFQLNFLEFNIPFGRNVGLVTGMGSAWNNYHFRNNVNVYEDVNGVMIAEPELEKWYNKNTLNMWNFNIPLLFEFQLPVSHKKPGVFVSFGVVGSAKVASWGKQHYYLEGDKYEIHKKSDFLINTLRYGFTARVGFKYLKLFANYDAVPLFQKDRGPELYPISIGITLLSF